MPLLLTLFLIFLSFNQYVLADCESYGVDFVNDGGPYCIDTTSNKFFSFTTQFQGCLTTDSQGDITPILIDPDENEYFCSDIPIVPEGVDMISTCNVTGNEVYKSQMYSGTWTIVIEGLTFAWMRSFAINAGPPVTITQTPTLTFNVTNTPSTTVTTTSTQIHSETLSPSTITLPSTTITKTVKTTPPKVTSTITSTGTRTRTTRTFSKTIITTTITPSCKTQPPRKDPICTIHPTKGLTSVQGVFNSTINSLVGRYTPDRRTQGRKQRIEPRAQLVARGPDSCTVTTIETTYIVSSYSTFTAPTSTETDTVLATSTSTITPPPITSYAGKAKITTTITLPTPTRYITTRTYTTTYVTKTIWATLIKDHVDYHQYPDAMGMSQFA